MPVVQLYGGQKVDTEALPGARRSATENDLSTGAVLDEAIARKDEAVAGLGGAEVHVADEGLRDVARVQKEEKDRADQIAVFDANNKLLEWKNQRLYDPNTGALTIKGKDSMPLPEQVGDEFKQYADSLATTMTTPKQQEAFQRLQLEHQTDLDLTLRRHVYGEMQTYEGNVLQATVSNNTDDAIRNANDPRRVGTALGNIVTAIQTSAPRLGLPPEMVTEQVAAAKSQVFTGVIGSLIDQGQQKAAQVYFDEVQSELKGPAIEHITRALNEGRVKKDGQSQTDSISEADPNGSLTDWLAKAREIQDPAVRDEVEHRLERKNALNAAATADHAKATLSNAYMKIDQGGSVDNISATDRLEISQHLPALREYELKRAKGEPIETDVPTRYRLNNLAGDDPVAFAKLDLMQYATKLSRPDLDRFEDIQLGLKKEDRAKVTKQLGPARLNQSIINNKLALYGIDPKAKYGTPEYNAIAELDEMLRQRVESQQNLTGKPVMDTDVEKMADQILSTGNEVKGSWWNVWPGSGPFFNGGKKAVSLTIDDVPATEKALISDSLRRAGRPVSDATILSLYIDAQVRKPKP